MKPTRILVVEDEDGMRRAIRQCLEHAGYAVEEAVDGRVALARLEEQSFDLVVTDIIIPDSDGLELVLKLRALRPQLPIIAISGGGQMAPEFYLRMTRVAGAVSTLAKPFPMEALLERIAAILGDP